MGGRLFRSDLPYIEKHPILLPPESTVCSLILRHFHEVTFHQGRVLTVASLRQAGFHIFRQKSVIGKFLGNCVTCRKLRAAPPKQLMSDLPADRLGKIAPFQRSGVDVCGPYLIHDGRYTRRTKATKKLWIVLFTCLYSRAIHVDTLNSMDTSTFVLALRRFSALRGECTFFRSDRGTNFVGCQGVVGPPLNIEKLVKEEGVEGIQWVFNPPGASHYAGVWERKIGALKQIFDSVLKLLSNRVLSREEFCTWLQEAAAVVNSTPLGEASADPNDPFPVSPSSLLNLRETQRCALPQDFTSDDLSQYGARRWRRVQFLAEEFWIRWKRDYLRAINLRRKWKRVRSNVKVGDVVLLRDKTPRSEWPLGVVTEACVGQDGLVRTVKVKRAPSAGLKKLVVTRAIGDVIILAGSD